MADDSSQLSAYQINMMRKGAREAFRAAGLKFDDAADLTLTVGGDEFELLGKKTS